MGLCSAVVGGLVYALASSSDVAVAGPTSIQSLIVLSALTAWDPQDARRIASSIAVLSAIMYLILWVLRLDRIFSVVLSDTLLSAFLSAAALVVGLNQLPLLFQVQVPHNHSALFYLVDFFKRVVPDTNLVSLFFAITCVFVLVAGKTSSKLIVPNVRLQSIMYGILVFLCTSLSMVVSYCMDLEGRYLVRQVGQIPSGFPSWEAPLFTSRFYKLLFPAFLCALIGYLQSVSVGSIYQKKHAEYTQLLAASLEESSEIEERLLDYQQGSQFVSGQELIALVFANLSSGLVFGYTVTTSITRTILNQSIGAYTSMSSIGSALIILTFVQSLGFVFAFLPRCILGSIVISAVVKPVLDGLNEVFRLYRWSRWAEAAVWVSTFFGVIFISVDIGLGIGIACNLVYIAFAHRSGMVASVETRNDCRSVLVLQGSLSYLHCEQIQRIYAQECIDVLDLRGVEHFDSSIVQVISKLQFHQIIVDADSDFPPISSAVIREESSVLAA
jgi:SulP family sulfate permease